MVFRKRWKKAKDGDAAFIAEDEAPPSDASAAADSAKAWVANTFSQVRGYGLDKLEETAERLNDAMPYIERAGFRVTEIEVEMSINPKLIPHVQIVDVMAEDDRPALLEEIAEKKLTTSIIKSLFRAADFGGRIDLKGFDFFEIEIEVGVIPGVILKYGSRKRIPD